MKRWQVFCSLSLMMLVEFAAVGAWAQVAPAAAQGKPLCLECIKVRLGLPRVVRGPSGDLGDNRFSEIALPDGRFRGFDAHGETRAIDGKAPWEMGGAGRVVLHRGKPGSVSSCGQWIQHVELVDGKLLGFVHDETACDYPARQTHKSMSLAVSDDFGLTWKDLGQMVTGTDKPTKGKNTGEGDCTAFNGEDGYLYQYCGRTRDRATIVLRAPVNNYAPGKWKKYLNGAWDSPGKGGDATPVTAGVTPSAALWMANGSTVLLGGQTGGLALYFGTDHVNFQHLAEPLLPLDPGKWTRPDPSEVLAYAVLLDGRTGGKQLSEHWMLTYAYWPPYCVSSEKYLVFRDVRVTVESKPQTPQVGVLLARWYNAAQHDRWSTTAAVPGNYTSYKLETKSGYLMTMAPQGKDSVQLEDCVLPTPGHSDHMLAEKGFCAAHGYQRLRTAGWVYAQAQAQPDTLPLYRCYNPAEHSHFASNAADCEKLGTAEKLLGYALKQ